MSRFVSSPREWLLAGFLAIAYTGCGSETGSSEADVPERTSPHAARAVTQSDLMAGAPVPAVCGHEAGTMVNGKLPNQDPMTGAVELGEVAFGDFTGDGADDAAAVVPCNAGGVPWPPWIILYTTTEDGEGVRLLGAIESSDEAIVGSEVYERTFVKHIAVDDGLVSLQVLGPIEPDAACCGSLTVDAELAWMDDSVNVKSSVRHYDLAAVIQVLAYIETGSAGGAWLSSDKPADDDVLSVVDDYFLNVVGAHAGHCYASADLGEADEKVAAAIESRLDNGRDEELRFCTIESTEADVDPLVLELEPDGEVRYRVTEIVPLS